LVRLIRSQARVLRKPLKPEPAYGAEQDATIAEDSSGTSAASRVQLELPWRPLLSLMVSLFGDPVPQIQGL
jgi:hypothetical protein